MRWLLPVLALVLTIPAQAQRTSSQLWPAEGTPTPTTTSIPVAYAASVGSTVGLIGAGMLLMYVDGDRFFSDEDAGVLGYVGSTVAGVGVLLGPSVGNLLLLGEDPSASRGANLRMVGVLTGVVVFGGSAVLVLMGSAGGSAAEGPLTAIAVLSGVLAGGGIVGGTVYDLATIPRNAERAREAVLEREARRAVQVGLAPVGGRPGVFAVVPL